MSTTKKLKIKFDLIIANATGHGARRHYFSRDNDFTLFIDPIFSSIISCAPFACFSSMIVSPKYPNLEWISKALTKLVKSAF